MKYVGQKFNESMVRDTSHENIPEFIRAWQDDVYGPVAVLRAVERLIAGQEPNGVRFITCDHPGNVGGGIITDECFIALGVDAVRFCTNAADPDGVGSSSVVASYDPDALRPAVVAVTLLEVLLRCGNCVFIAK